MHDSGTLAEHLETLERELLTPTARRSERVDRLLAEDFLEFGTSGRTYTKADMVMALRNEAPTRITATDFQLKQFGPDIALLTYRSCRYAESPVHALRSSIWRHEDGQWRMVFHQGTPAAS